MSQTTPYRPPIWAQQSKYSAADARRLTEGIYLDGVIAPNHLKVTQRIEGPNLSVDVSRGEVVVFGNQHDEGRYLCSFNPGVHKVNIPVAAGPAAGQSRYDCIGAQVNELTGTWEVIRVHGNASATASWNSWSRPSSFYPLAIIGPIKSNTGTVILNPNAQELEAGTHAHILDCRWISRPAPLGGFVTLRRRLPPITVFPGQTRFGWGDAIQCPVLPWDSDVHVTFTAGMSSTWREPTLVRFGIQMWGWDVVGHTLQNSTWDYSLSYSAHEIDSRILASQAFATTPAFQGPPYFQPVIGHEPGWAIMPKLYNGEFVVRMSPRGGLVD